ncbi:MAG: isocitrate/isopropylmalate dehydrogenase family protein, partial [Rhodospirillales bacterium]|nr:isocitrate/isopropylmalate dehydrogenase family protein [Rhodospirillales bacterium]
RGGDDRLNKAAQGIEAAVDTCLEDSSSRTRDLGGSGSTETFASETARLIGEV